MSDNKDTLSNRHRVNNISNDNHPLKSSLTNFVITTSCALSLNLLTTCFTPALADSFPNPCPWVFTGSLGYTEFDNVFGDDGETAFGRLSIGKEFYKSDTLSLGSEMSFGVELGVQTGNSMRLFFPQSLLIPIGGVTLQTTVKPIVDLLLTFRTNTLENIPIFTQMKVGGAYRQLQFENRAIGNLSKISPELQIGLGYLVNDMVNVTLSYQGIYGGNPDFTIFPATRTARVANIPTQNGVLLGIAFTV